MNGRSRRDDTAKSGRRPVFACSAALWFVLLSGLSAAQNPMHANSLDIEAAYLRNFARYVVWPDTAFDSERAPWRVCVLGADPFGDTLESTFEGRTEQGRSFVLVRGEQATELATCQIVYVAYPGSARRRAALAALAKQPVLTVGDAPEFLEEGGMIRFHVSDHVEFDVNLDRARASSLSIRTKMLEVAGEVTENGIVRKRR